jgi:hypothetical protein
MASIPWLIGLFNDMGNAGPENPGGYATGMWLFTLLGTLGVVFSFLLRKAESGPGAHGLETITARKSG